MTKTEIKRRISFDLQEVKMNNCKGVAKIKDLALAKEKILNVLDNGFKIKNIENLGLLAVGDVYDNKLTIKYYLDVYFNSGIVQSCEVIVYDLRKDGEWRLI